MGVWPFSPRGVSLVFFAKTIHSLIHSPFTGRRVVRTREISFSLLCGATPTEERKSARSG